MKRSILKARVEKVQIKPQKRRRPSKKLVATLESLADVLPELDPTNPPDPFVSDTRIKQTSLKSKPGALKKKEKQDRLEMERFNKNLAEIMRPMEGGKSEAVRESASSDDQQTAASTNRWHSLRDFILLTMEQKH